MSTVNNTDIWRELGSNLKHYIAKRVDNQYDVEDILQDAFCKIHSNLSKLESSDKLLAWSYQIASNAIVDYYRGRKERVGLTDVTEAPVESVEDENFNMEITPCLRPMINKLPDKYRQAITLIYLDGLTQREMSQKLGLSLSGAKSRVQRGRAKLKGMLTECCQFEFDRLGNIINYQQKEKSCGYCSSKPGKE